MMGAISGLRASVAPLAVLCAPAVARACPVCFAARDEAERIALIGTTVFMTALPVIMIGGIIVWVARRSRELDEESSPNREDGADDAPGGEVIPLHRS